MRARRLSPTGAPAPVVLVACGSFNPPTHMHLRMFHLASDALAERGYDVLGGYMSPVGDGYGKGGLLPSALRIEMCRLAAASSKLIMVDTWEAAQPEWQRTLTVLDRIHTHVDAALSGAAAPPHPAGADAAGPSGRSAAGASEHPASEAAGPASSHTVSVRLLCGSDLLESFCRPGVWREEQLRQLFERHGVVCVTRQGCGLDALLADPSTILHRYQDRILLVEEPVPNAISSSLVRVQAGAGRSLKYLVPPAVETFISERRLYE